MEPTDDTPKEPKKVCGAKKRKKPGETCDKPPMKDRDRCELHGGKTPKGPDSPHWQHGNGGRGNAKTGKARQQLRDLAKDYEQAKGDPELTHFRHDIALYEAMRRQITQGIDTTKRVSDKDREALIQLGEQIRKLKDSEYRRLQILQSNVPIEQHRRAQAQTAAIVFEVVDRRTKAVIQAIQDGLPKERLVSMLAGIEWTQEMARLYRIEAMRIPAIMDLSEQGAG